MKGDVVTEMLKFLPYDINQIDEIDKSFKKSIQGIFLSTVEIVIYHTLLTWLIFDIHNIRFVFLFSLISGILSLIPIISPWIILIPANFIYFFDNDLSIIHLGIFNISYYLLISNVDSDIYKKNVKGSDPYITGLSFVMGMYTFGFKGMIYGPVLLCFSITVMDIIRIIIKFN
jgi:predicted PurR-regulated permease PerM